MTTAARKEMGFLLRLLRDGETQGLPHSRPMRAIGSGCHELRVTDVGGEWRLIYALTNGAVVVLDVFHKKTRTTPLTVINQCAKRLRDYSLRNAK